MASEYRKELEKDNVLSVQHKVEEEMSQALIRECPKCKSRFFKTEGMQLRSKLFVPHLWYMGKVVPWGTFSNVQIDIYRL